MTRFQASSAATRKNRPLSTGFETEAEARSHAEFLADTYGGVAKVTTSVEVVAKYSTKRGWH